MSLAQMDTVIAILREKRKIRDEEFSGLESQLFSEHVSQMKHLQHLQDETRQYAETIGKNLNFVTSHEHAIRKVVHESKQQSGLPISNKYHKQTADFINGAIEFLNDAEKLYEKQNVENIDPDKINIAVQSCAQSTSDIFNETQSSVRRVEALMQNKHVIIAKYKKDEISLEKSIFDD